MNSSRCVCFLWKKVKNRFWLLSPEFRNGDLRSGFSVLSLSVAIFKNNNQTIFFLKCIIIQNITRTICAGNLRKRKLKWSTVCWRMKLNRIPKLLRLFPLNVNRVFIGAFPSIINMFRQHKNNQITYYTKTVMKQCLTCSLLSKNSSLYLLLHI